jgi:hypothetical protein
MPFTSQDIWEGGVEVFPILRHFSASLAASATPGDTIVNFMFPKLPEFKDIPGKTYKIDRNWTVSHIVAVICKRLDISPSKRYQLTTLRGFPLPDNDNLASYGLGSLLPNWQLKLERKKQAGAPKGLTRVATLARFDPRFALRRRDDDEDEDASPRPENRDAAPTSEGIVESPHSSRLCKTNTSTDSFLTAMLIASRPA